MFLDSGPGLEGPSRNDSRVFPHLLVDENLTLDTFLVPGRESQLLKQLSQDWRIFRQCQVLKGCSRINAEPAYLGMFIADNARFASYPGVQSVHMV